MSINHYLNKIKGQMGIDTYTMVCLLVIILVGLSSFGLGRLSVSQIDDNSEIIFKDTNTSFVKGEIGDSLSSEEYLKNDSNIIKEKMYVASKNGKLYYSASCSGAKRIAEKNEVWFENEIEAKKAGYTLSSSCK